MITISTKGCLAAASILSLILLGQCTPKSTETDSSGSITSAAPRTPLKISLAEWSIHRSLDEGVLKAEDFASIAKNDFGVDAVEYVASFYRDHATDESYWKMMRHRSDSLGVKNLLIMVDEEGDLGSGDPVARKKAVENHYKWVNAASILGCHSIRVNAFGEGTKDEMKAHMVDALKQLCSYANEKNINVLIENHGLYSSDGEWVATVILEVGMPNCGTLPDFGNWCTSEKWGSTEAGKPCANVYDRYKGVSEMLPFAKGLSAKSYAFDAQGNETIIDFSKMLKMIKDNPDFTGYVDIEYEGSQLSEPEGIRATKALLERTWNDL